MRCSMIIAVAVLLLSVTVIGGEKYRLPVYNPLPSARQTETVEVRLAYLTREAGWLKPAGMIVVDAATNDTLVSQILGDLFLCQSSFGPKERKVYLLMNSDVRPAQPASSVQAKYILPRKDVAWENDRIAYRIYGGPLAGNVKSGLDVWVKRVRYQIIDKWYDGDSLKGPKRISYHIDHGEGADMFDVGRSLGAGACAILAGGGLHYPGWFDDQKITASGPIRSQFTVIYSDSLNGKPYREEATYTLDAGQNLNRIEVRYTGPGLPKKLKIAAGLVKRKNSVDFLDKKNGCLSMWGPVNDDTTNGYLGTGIIFPEYFLSQKMKDSTHALIPGAAWSGKTFTYYAGAGWTRSGDFAGLDDWNSYLAGMAARIRHPLQVGDEKPIMMQQKKK